MGTKKEKKIHEDSQKLIKKKKKKEDKLKKKKRKREISSNNDLTTEKNPKSNADKGKDSALPVSSSKRERKSVTNLRQSTQNPFLHGLTALELPSRDVVQKMNSEKQHKHIASLGNECEKIIDILVNCIAASNQDSEKDTMKTTQEQMITDMSRLKRVSIAKQYVEMTLWRRIVESNRKHLKIAHDLGYGLGSGQQNTVDNGILSNSIAMDNIKHTSYRDKFLNGVLSTHSEELNTIRERETLDADDVAYMVRCLEAGADLYANLKALDENASDENR